MFNKGIKREIKIEGMMCDNCAKHVKNAIESIDGVKKCSVSLKDKTAKIVSDKKINNDEIKSKVAEAGYEVTSIK